MKQFCFILFLSLFTGTIYSQTLPAGFSMSNIASGWNLPVGTAANSNGQKLFVWEKDGRVYVCNWNAGSQQYVKQTTPVLDISPEVGGWRDFGLIGFALDPNFDSNGLIYLLYVVDRHYLMNFGTASYDPAANDYYKATIGRVTRYKTVVNGSGTITADLNTRTILLGETKETGIPILYESHGVGSLAFASDGMLLVSAGDGACYIHSDVGSDADTYFAQALTDGIIRQEENVGALRSQMINSLSGKILRINPSNGDGVSSNPFYDPNYPRAAKSRVWALGLRNPFRMSVKPNTGSTDPATGDIGEIYLGDVGWDNYEEIDIADRAASNFGWPIFEGNTSTAAHLAPFSANVENKDEVNPLFGGGGCAQNYFYFNNLIKQATADNNTTVYNPCNNAVAIVSGNSNRFFHHRPLLDWDHNSATARVGTFSGNTATVAVIGTPQSGVTGTPFRGNCAVGGCWYTGDMFPADYKNTYIFADYGAQWLNRATMLSSVSLKQIDPFITGFGAIVHMIQDPLDGSMIAIDLLTNSVKKINYGGGQPPVVKMTSDKIFGSSALAVTFTGSSSYDPEGGALTYLWNFGDGNTSTAADPPVHSFTSAANVAKKFVVTLTVKDNMNLASTDSIIISVNNTPPKVQIISPKKNSRYTIGSDTTYSLQANVTDDEQTDGQLTYVWQTILRHNNHQHAETPDTNRITSSLISRIGCNGDIYYYLFKLKVTDAAGLSTEDSSKIFPLCPGDVILPVTLTSFSVNTQNGINNIKWTTESEINSKSFILERSINGTDFQVINQQPAKNIPGSQQYFYPDNTHSGGINYYRLKMVDINGSFTYSKTIKVFNGSDADFSLRITPNPVFKDFTLSTAYPENGPVTIRITDITGKIVKQISDNVSKGYVTMQIYQLDKLKPATYFVEVIQKDYKRNTKFVKVD
ncbi:MAG: PQQ-dependent sugar dehydrogenase [Bacteroidetes bacterium]|nr:PQQ-dependent sugar dehydrogenase [Bacteroidota bacterium]